MDKVYKTLTATVKDLGEGVIEAVVASEKEDRYGEILVMDGPEGQGADLPEGKGAGVPDAQGAGLLPQDWGSGG